MKRAVVRFVAAAVVAGGIVALGWSYLSRSTPFDPSTAAFTFAVGAAYLAMLLRPSWHRGRDPQRWFDYGQRAVARERAGGRCEYTSWGRRCERPSEEIDHFVPWSRGGATSLTNAVSACRRHNQRKGGRMPSTLDAFALFWRRRTYFTSQDNSWPGQQYRRTSRRREELCR